MQRHQANMTSLVTLQAHKKQNVCVKKKKKKKTLIVYSKTRVALLDSRQKFEYTSLEIPIKISHRPEGDIFYYYASLEIPIQSSHRPEGDSFYYCPRG